jgi:hypothetical protein
MLNANSDYSTVCVRFEVLTAVSMKFRVVWHVVLCGHDEVNRRFRGVLPPSCIALMMEAVRTSETSVNFKMTTWRYIPEDSKLQLYLFPT